MKGGIEDVKEISPMFPRLNVKDAEKGGPKAPPRNKMALYEQFTIPSQSFAFGSPSKFPPLLGNIHSTSGHVNLVGSSQGIQFSNSSGSYLAEKIHAYHSRSINLTKLVPDGFVNCNNSLKEYKHEDTSITPVSGHGRNSCRGISQNKEDEDKHAQCKSSCSLKSQNSFSKKANLTRPVKLKSARYGKNQIDDHTEVNQGDQKPGEGFAPQLVGFGDMTDESSISSVKVRTPNSMKKGHTTSMEEFRGISVESLKMLQSSNNQTNREDAATGGKINPRDGYLEKPVLSDVHEGPDGLEIGRKCFWGKRDRQKSEDMYSHYDDALNKPISIIGLDITPDDVLGVIGEKQFWKARRTIIKHLKANHASGGEEGPGARRRSRRTCVGSRESTPTTTGILWFMRMTQRRSRGPEKLCFTGILWGIHDEAPRLRRTALVRLVCNGGGARDAGHDTNIDAGWRLWLVLGN